MSALSATARQEYYTELGNALPPPVLDKLEYRERRLIAAVETFEALRPGDAYEARLAVRIVLCGAHAAEGLREAGVYRDDYAKLTRCRAQAASMMRAENSAKRALEREQKVRLAAEAVAESAPAQPAVAPAAPPSTEPEATAPPPIQATEAARPQAPARSAPPPSAEAVAQAEALVEEDMLAAARIRRDGGITPQNQACFRHLALPADPAVIDALVRGTSELLTLLDDAGGRQLEAAA